MKKQSLIFLALLSVSIAAARTRSYDVTLDQPSMVGNVRLQPGEYKLKLEGSQAIFIATEDGKTATTPAKTEQAGRKYDYTALESHKDGSLNRIDGIELGGTRLKVDFD